jgi:NhaA family Na+:H+ antiporter
MFQSLKQLLRGDSAPGIWLIIAATAALLLANSPLEPAYTALLDMPVEVRFGPLHIGKPFLLWINDGLMAIFFFLVGLELKREFMEGALADPRNIGLPGVGAIGGMLVPAAIYAWLNWDDPIAINGWAIPAATDIAFALGILSLFGNRVPSQLKLFLVTLAIFDDIGAIIIIALFYTAQLSVGALLIAATCLLLLHTIHRRGVIDFSPYLLIGLIMWVALLKSGVHATLSGVLLALFIPIRDPNNPAVSPLRDLEHDLHNTVSFGILPLFAFANAGLPLSGIGLHELVHAVPLGISAGLFFGKQIGVFLFCWLSVRIGLLRLPDGIDWRTLYGVSILCGVGFTMSLFIGSLAFESVGEIRLFDERLGILSGSLLSAIVAYFFLDRTLPAAPSTDSRR